MFVGKYMITQFKVIPTANLYPNIFVVKHKKIAHLLLECATFINLA